MNADKYQKNFYLQVLKKLANDLLKYIF